MWRHSGSRSIRFVATAGKGDLRFVSPLDYFFLPGKLFSPFVSPLVHESFFFVPRSLVFSQVLC
jgi:hypothetical protein